MEEHMILFSALCSIVNFGWAYWIYYYQKRLKQKWLQTVMMGVGAMNFIAGIVTALNVVG